MKSVIDQGSRAVKVRDVRRSMSLFWFPVQQRQRRAFSRPTVKNDQFWRSNYASRSRALNTPLHNYYDDGNDDGNDNDGDDDDGVAAAVTKTTAAEEDDDNDLPAECAGLLANWGGR
jgi:hypothetical protein